MCESKMASNSVSEIRRDLPPQIVEIVNYIFEHIGTPVSAANPSLLDKIVGYARSLWTFIQKFTSYSSPADQQALLQRYVASIVPADKRKKKTSQKNIAAYHRSLVSKKRSLDPNALVHDMILLSSKLLGTKPTNFRLYRQLGDIDFSGLESDGAASSNDVQEELPSELPSEEVLEEPPIEEKPSQDPVQLVASYDGGDAFSLLAPTIQERIGSSKIVIVMLN